MYEDPDNYVTEACLLDRRIRLVWVLLVMAITGAVGCGLAVYMEAL